MTDNRKDKAKKEEERRKAERFAWLGPLLERRKAEAEAIESDKEEAGLEEAEEQD